MIFTVYYLLTLSSCIKKNLIRRKTLMEMPEAAIPEYHNKILSATEVIGGLNSVSIEIRDIDKNHRRWS